MRKLAIVLIIVILVVSFVASSKKFDPETYVSEGLQTSFGILVDSNQMFYNEVFALGHLKTDKNKTYAQVLCHGDSVQVMLRSANGYNTICLRLYVSQASSQTSSPTTERHPVAVKSAHPSG